MNLQIAIYSQFLQACTILYASSLSVFRSYDCTFFIISQLLCVLNVYLYIIIHIKNVSKKMLASV